MAAVFLWSLAQIGLDIHVTFYVLSDVQTSQQILPEEMPLEFAIASFLLISVKLFRYTSPHKIFWLFNFKILKRKYAGNIEDSRIFHLTCVQRFKSGFFFQNSFYSQNLNNFLKPNKHGKETQGKNIFLKIWMTSITQIVPYN